MPLSTHDRENFGRIMEGYGDWFSAVLLRLIAKADWQNRTRLRLGFPEHVQAYEEWCRTGEHPRGAVASPDAKEGTDGV